MIETVFQCGFSLAILSRRFQKAILSRRFQSAILSRRFQVGGRGDERIGRADDHTKWRPRARGGEGGRRVRGRAHGRGTRRAGLASGKANERNMGPDQAGD